MLNPTIDKKRIVADAEKAFTNVLQTKYNTIRYAKYPRGEDGLHGEGLDRYGYVIDEDLTFRTTTTTIRGCHKALERDALEALDMIFISKDNGSSRSRRSRARLNLGSRLAARACSSVSFLPIAFVTRGEESPKRRWIGHWRVRATIAPSSSSQSALTSTSARNARTSTSAHDPFPKPRRANCLFAKVGRANVRRRDSWSFC